MKQLLTGKCLDDFEKWYLKTHYSKSKDTESKKYHIRSFWTCRLDGEQFGVIQDFADSVKMPFFVKHVENYIYEVTYDFWVYGYGWGENFKTRSQAQEEAIKQFNIYYNEKH